MALNGSAATTAQAALTGERAPDEPSLPVATDADRAYVTATKVEQHLLYALPSITRPASTPSTDGGSPH